MVYAGLSSKHDAKQDQPCANNQVERALHHSDLRYNQPRVPDFMPVEHMELGLLTRFPALLVKLTIEMHENAMKSSCQTIRHFGRSTLKVG